MTKWLAIFTREDGDLGAAVINDQAGGMLPFGVTPTDLGLEGYDAGGASIAFVSLPDDAEFPVMVVDNDANAEVELQHIDL